MYTVTALSVISGIVTLRWNNFCRLFSACTERDVVCISSQVRWTVLRYVCVRGRLKYATARKSVYAQAIKGDILRYLFLAFDSRSLP